MNLLVLSAILFFLSAAYSVRLSMIDPIENFFSPLGRFWELVLGGIIAWCHTCGTTKVEAIRIPFKNAISDILYDKSQNGSSKNIRTTLSLLGVCFLGFTLFQLEATPSQSTMFTMGAVLGSAFIIIAGESSFFNREIISRNILVGIGLISYPLYLWHWPALSIAKIIRSQDSSLPAYLVFFAILFSLLLALLTYRFVERPIRVAKKPGKVALVLFFLMGVPLGLGSLAFFSHGMIKRFPNELRNTFFSIFEYSTLYREGTCFLRSVDSLENFRLCPSSKGSSGKKLLLWGESFAAHLYPGLSKRFEGRIEIIQRTFGDDCKSRSYQNETIKGDRTCEGSLKFLSSQIDLIKPELLIISSSFFLFDHDLITQAIHLANNAGVEKIFLLGPVTRWHISLPRQIFRNYVSSFPRKIPERTFLGFRDELFKVDQNLSTAFQSNSVTYLSLLKILCNKEGCLTKLNEKNGALIQWDHGHFTAEGSEYVVSQFPNFLKD